jgi:hypothetical protein
MLVEKELMQEQKEANLVAFAEYLEQKKHESQERFKKQIKDKTFLENLPIVELKPFSKKF